MYKGILIGVIVEYFSHFKPTFIFILQHYIVIPGLRDYCVDLKLVCTFQVKKRKIHHFLYIFFNSRLFACDQPLNLRILNLVRIFYQLNHMIMHIYQQILF